jgi:CHAT domain-containing protein/tetratricopeptide (TPR) repeat protein
MAFQSGTRGVSSPKIRSVPEEAPEFGEMRARANALFRAGDYLPAMQLYQAGYEDAKRRGSPRTAVRFLNNLGGANYRMFRYRDAIQAYLAARDLATSLHDQETLGALDVNLSSLYLRMGEIDAALESAERGLKLPRDATSQYRAKLLIQCALIKARQTEPAQAAVLLRDAIESARGQLDMAAEAEAWNELGNVLMNLGQIPGAERAVLEAFRLRKLTRGDLHFAYESLGELRVLQGDLPSASGFFGRALESARVNSPQAMGAAYYGRGKVKLAQSQLEEAFADFGAALESIRRWRAEVLPADVFRVSAEVELDRVYSSFIEAGSRLYAATGRKEFVEQAFAAAEESRAASLRALWAGPDLTKRMPGEYWQALADLYRAEAHAVREGADGNGAAIREQRLRLAEMEARAGLDFPPDRSNAGASATGALERTRKVLGGSEAYLGFHLGDAESCLWVVTREGFEFRRLPGRAQFVAAIARFVNALRENSPEAVELGKGLYAQLFDGVNPGLLSKPAWVVAPDGPLFELPFAALVEQMKPDSGGPVYVVERHSVRIVPGIPVLSEGAAPEVSSEVVGLGDPIYNRADQRLPREAAGAAPAMELARLPGTGREVESCAGIWRSHGYQPVLLNGAAATRENLADALRRNPAIVHVAAHVLFATQPLSPGMIALTLHPGSGIELLSATEIASMRLKLGLVVLNGCSSGRAPALPGAGLMGMTRAWLAAGARGVIVTRWPVADLGEGELFQSFYRSLSPARTSRQRRSYAELLQEAQLAELHAGGGRANAARWAAYFCVERN